MRAACPHCISTERLIGEVAKLRRRPGGAELFLHMRLVGVLTVLDTDANRRNFQPGAPPAGYGRFGRYPMLLTARAVERWSVLDARP